MGSASKVEVRDVPWRRQSRILQAVDIRPDAFVVPRERFQSVSTLSWVQHTFTFRDSSWVVDYEDIRIERSRNELF